MAGSLKLINVNKLVKLKYNICEANWITNLSKLYLKEKNIEMSVDSDGHTGFTHMYTKVIVSKVYLIKNSSILEIDGQSILNAVLLYAEIDDCCIYHHTLIEWE